MTWIQYAAVAGLAFWGAFGALAQTADVKANLKAMKPADYPIKPIELSVGAPPGGALDITARLVAQKFQEYTGETMVVVNRVGAGGLIFHRWITTQASADGYQLGLGSNLIIADSILRSDNKWSYKDADNLAFVNYEPIVWLASTSGRYKDRSLSEILKAAKADPGGVKVGVVATTFIEMLPEQIEHKASIVLNKVPFNGSAPSLSALLGNHIDISFGFVGEFQGYGDRVRPLAVASAKPVDTLPGVPTFNSILGGTDINWLIWRYIIAPKGISDARKAWLLAAFSESLKDPQLVEEFKKRGGVQDKSIDSPAKIRAELDRMADAERNFYVQTGRLSR